MLFQISLLNQLAQIQLDRIAIGGQKSYCISNSDPAPFLGDCQHFFLQRRQLLQELFALDLSEQDVFLLFQAGQEETQPVIKVLPFAPDQLL